MDRMRSAPETPEEPTSGLIEPVEVIRLGKDEMNLAEFPITLLTDRVPKGKKMIQYQDVIYDEKNGKHLARKLTISADEANGLPTAVDDDVILGLIQITKLVNNFTSREVEFRRLDLIELLGWPDSGDSYRRLATSLKRWLSVTLLYENAWRDNRKGAWTTKGFHILDNIELNDSRAVGPRGELFPSKIIWNKVVFESFEAGYLKSIDYRLYVNLKHTIARRLYRFLSKRMYFGPDLKFDLHDLAFAHVGLSDNYSGNAGKIKEKLRPALEELEAVGFLEPMSKEERYRKIGKRWEIRLAGLGFAVAPAPAPPTPAAPNPKDFESELIERGVSAKSAAELARQFPTVFIEGKIQEFDWRMTQPKPPRKPAGYLVKSIRDGYATDPDFVSAAERQRQREANQAKERQDVEDRRRKQAEDAAERARAARVTAYRRKATAEQLARLEADAIALASEETRRNLDDPAMKPFRKTLVGRLTNDHIAGLIQAGRLEVEPG
jgi:hypothetical protein